MKLLVYAFSSGLLDLTQCVSHLTLAFKYRRVAKEMPYAYIEVQLPEAEKRCDKVLFKLLLTINIIFPALETLLIFLFGKDILQYTIPSKALAFFLSCISVFIAMIQIVSGCFLVRGLTEIRSFISSRQIGGGLNIKTFLKHAGAFGFYLFSLAINLVTTVTALF